MFGVICAHCGLANNMVPQKNPYDIEEVWWRIESIELIYLSFDHCSEFVFVSFVLFDWHVAWHIYLLQKYFTSVHMVIINGANALQAFFSITGFLISIQFMELREKTKFNISLLWKAIVYRFLRYVIVEIVNSFVLSCFRILNIILSKIVRRFTPVYVIILMFNATFLYKLRTGPSWPILADAERIACRRNWWTNLLYINNFVKASEPVRLALLLFRSFTLNVLFTFVLFFFYTLHCSLSLPLS